MKNIRNMITGASTSQLAIILIDARKGVLTQTRRHSYICHLLGIKNIILAVNKMDLVNYDKNIFDTIVNDYKKFANSIGIKNFQAIPITGTDGDNIIFLSANTKWYDGLTLINYLESIEILPNKDKSEEFYMPIQWVNRPPGALVVKLEVEL